LGVVLNYPPNSKEGGIQKKSGDERPERWTGGENRFIEEEGMVGKGKKKTARLWGREGGG